MSNSTHQVEVVPIKMEKHPNADSLSICNVFGGYTCVVRTEDWKGVELGAYLPPDSVVDTARPEFAFLATEAKADGTHRIRAKKLRGIVSFGLMAKAPEGSKPGDDVASILGVTHYEPPLPGQAGTRGGLITGGEAAKPPDIYTVKYDVDAFRRYHRLFVEGEPVWVTEKIHGCSSKYVYHDGQMHCGSRTEWKKEFPTYDHVTMEYLTRELMKKHVRSRENKMDQVTSETNLEEVVKDVETRAKEIFDKLHNKPKQRNLWWNALTATPALERFLIDHPDHVVHGEVFGQVQTLKYGATAERPLMFAAFDVMKDGKWLDAAEANALGRELPWVPLLSADLPYGFDAVASLSDGPSRWPGANHHREGCVVKPLKERTDPHVGRVCLKCVGATYLEKDKS